MSVYIFCMNVHLLRDSKPYLGIENLMLARINLEKIIEIINKKIILQILKKVPVNIFETKEDDSWGGGGMTSPDHDKRTRSPEYGECRAVLTSQLQATKQNQLMIYT